MGESATDPVLRTHNLSKRYGKRLALSDLTLEVERGKVHGFLGPNGAGKTTAISLILGLMTPTAGRVELFGLDTRTHLTAALHRVGAVLEGVAFYPHLNARDNLRICAAISGVANPRIEDVLGVVGLSGRAKDKTRGYSMGMRQRLAVAAALLHEPELLILDEPTNGLDPAGMREFRELIRELGASGKTVFVSSHMLNEVEQMCDEVTIIKNGRLITQDSVATLLQAGDALELRVTDDEVAIEVLRALEFVRNVTREGNRLIVDAPRMRAADMSRALATRGVYLHELRPRENSLEDFFLEVTTEVEAA